MRSGLGLGVLGCALTVSLTAQQSGGDILAQARMQIQARNLDSAAALLSRITDSTSWNDSLRRIDALVLLGIVRYYQGRGAASVTAFRAAIELDPALQVPRLADLDPPLSALFDSARVAVAAAPSPDTLYSCSPRCEGLDVAPKPLDSGPPLRTSLLVLADIGGESLHGSALLRAIVDTLGRVEPGSVEVVHSTVPQELLDYAMRTLLAARFHPGRAHGRAVRVLIERRIEMRPKTH